MAELADVYRDSRQGQVSVRAWESDESALRVHIVPAFGRLPISSVSSVQIERFLTDLAVSRSVRTAARVRTTLRGLFRYAVRTRRLPVSPAEDVPLPHPDSRTGKVVEVDPFTLELLLDVVETQRGFAGRYGDLTLVLGLTGLRFGELRGLRVRDVVSVPYPGLVVKRSLPQSGRTGAVIERATTKSGRTRLVPLSDRVRPSSMPGPRGGAEDVLFPAPGGRLHPRPELAARGALVDHGPRAASARPAAHGGQPVDRGRCGHQDGVGVAGSLDREADAGHLRPPHGDRRRPGGPGTGEPGSRVPDGYPEGDGAESGSSGRGQNGL